MNNSVRKQLLASSAAYILGLKPQVEIAGTEKQKKVYKEALISSKNLYQTLQEGNDSILENALIKKKRSAVNFHKEFGWHWPF